MYQIRNNFKHYLISFNYKNIMINDINLKNLKKGYIKVNNVFLKLNSPNTQKAIIELGLDPNSIINGFIYINKI